MPMPNMVGTPLQFKAGDTKSFTTIYNELYAPLIFYARKILDNPGTAEDIVQEAFIRFWQQPGSFESFKCIKNWLYITTRNACFNHLEKKVKSHTVQLSDYPAVPAEPNVLNSITQAEVLKELYASIEALPPVCRTVIRLSFIEGKSNKEIAEQLNLAMSTVKNQKLRGLSLIRKQSTGRRLLYLLFLLSFFSDN